MFSIGDLSQRTGVKVSTIRYYETIGLIAPAARTDGNQRRYDAQGMRRLGFIRHARDLGLSLDAVRALVALDGSPDHPCADAHEIAAAHLEDIRARIARLTRLEAELSRIAAMQDDGDAGCCRVLEALGDHADCAGPH